MFSPFHRIVYFYNMKTSRMENVWFQKISIPSSRKVIGNSERERGSQKSKFLKEGMKLNWNFQGGGGWFKPKNLPWKGMEIFWNHTIR